MDVASRDWHRAAVEAERQRDNAIAQLEYEQANRRKEDAKLAHERDDFIKELETANTGMLAALGAIQEQHHIVYLDVDDEVRGLNPMCNVCMRAYPCRTRRLADQGLGGGQDG